MLVLCLKVANTECLLAGQRPAPHDGGAGLPPPSAQRERGPGERDAGPGRSSPTAAPHPGVGAPQPVDRQAAEPTLHGFKPSLALCHAGIVSRTGHHESRRLRTAG